ncbi:thioesterase domain-containing protein [Kibdelosporangium banguiense]|uniref:Thioesterase domain-containing protein n=1 Tax=Kibdelosporangium banguiense TaxID=1365924 RepID=A0ABS4TZ99_9PSEU|nr:alpha/beta fold hydrolase [Kibdelosporangium banguiense]MBP2329727.1 thioesterase domain-containing protein [Kibdelosporangium banguiense]
MDSVVDTLVAIKPSGAKPPLHCVPAVSGSPYAYNGLARLLDKEQPLYGFEAPGFDNERAPVASLRELAAEYTEALRSAQPGPYCLLGWSMGGVIAFEMALRLTEAGQEVPLLILVDAVTPLKADTPDQADMTKSFLYDLMAAAAVEKDTMDSVLAGAAAEPDAAFGWIERAGLLPEELDAEFLSERYAVFHAHIEASYGYETDEIYRGGPVLAIKAAATPPDRMRWERFAANVEEHVIDADHHSIWQGDRLIELSQVVQRRLDGEAG